MSVDAEHVAVYDSADDALPSDYSFTSEKTPLFIERDASFVDQMDQSADERSQNNMASTSDVSMGNMSALNVATDLLESLDLRSMYMRGYGHKDAISGDEDDSVYENDQELPSSTDRLPLQDIPQRPNSKRVPSLTFSCSGTCTSASSTDSASDAMLDAVQQYDTWYRRHQLRSKSLSEEVLSDFDPSRNSSMRSSSRVSHRGSWAPSCRSESVSSRRSNVSTSSKPLPPIPADEPWQPENRALPNVPEPVAAAAAATTTTVAENVEQKEREPSPLPFDYKPLEPLTPIQEAALEDASDTTPVTDLHTPLISRSKVLARVESKRATTSESRISLQEKEILDEIEKFYSDNKSFHSILSHLQSNNQSSAPASREALADSSTINLARGFDADETKSNMYEMSPKSDDEMEDIVIKEVPRHPMSAGNMSTKVVSLRGRIRSSSSFDNLSAIIGSNENSPPMPQKRVVSGTKRVFSNLTPHPSTESVDQYTKSDSPYSSANRSGSDTGTVRFRCTSATSAYPDSIHTYGSMAPPILKRDEAFVPVSRSFDIPRARTAAGARALDVPFPATQYARPHTAMCCTDAYATPNPVKQVTKGKLYLHLADISDVRLLRGERIKKFKCTISTGEHTIQLPWQMVGEQMKMDHDFMFSCSDDMVVDISFTFTRLRTRTKVTKSAVAHTRSKSEQVPSASQKKPKKRGFFSRLFRRGHKKQKVSTKDIRPATTSPLKRSMTAGTPASPQVAVSTTETEEHGHLRLELARLHTKCLGKVHQLALPIVDEKQVEAAGASKLPSESLSVPCVIGRISLRCLYVPPLHMDEDELPNSLEQAEADLQLVKWSKNNKEGYLYVDEKGALQKRFAMLTGKLFVMSEDKGGPELCSFELRSSLLAHPLAEGKQAGPNGINAFGFLMYGPSGERLKCFASSAEAMKSWIDALNKPAARVSKASKLWLQKLVSVLNA
ncbi:medial ring protein Mid1 [Schizosaccharomyces japonicus yFS275]|uniref:Medial ring protein Mid1 n=1 Tax=Schizosaccharomyces japonicus (strain yFS275 / FY16936) TaxID=402676 RepID=B6JZV3_SCHJY|nr:medial ring protein Mid1 [Schizosaccharomyces japonicus yFS275]EEB06103.1 medial ring protein Mid1 [Schizosaccharomyces japonicus yFS275]